MFDTHTHTTMSTDGKMTAEEAIGAARSLGLGIIFTEHYDADSPDNDYDFRVDVPRYMSEYERYRSDDTLLGIEVGLTHLSAKRNAETIAKGDFDFVLGSVHMIGLTDIYLDLTHSENPTITKEDYLEYVLRMVRENDDYDAFGHIDYPSRYFAKNAPDLAAGGPVSDARPDGKYSDPEMDYHEFKDIYDPILRTLAEKEKPLELNTRRLKRGTALKNTAEILKAYKNSGGRLVTIGSDAHYTHIVGENFGAAIAMARELSLTPVYFRNRKIVRIPGV